MLGFTSVPDPASRHRWEQGAYDSNYFLKLPTSRLDPINRIRVARLSRILTLPHDHSPPQVKVEEPARMRAACLDAVVQSAALVTSTDDR